MRSGVSLTSLDPSVRPADDLFGFANGGWLAATEIPPDRAVHGTFRIVSDRAEEQLRAIVEEAAAGSAEPGAPSRLVGDVFAAFMDEDKVEELGFQPVRPQLDAALAAADTSELLRQLGRCQAEGGPGAFYPFVDTDARESTAYRLHLEQGGLGLPDESYYREERFAGIREAYAGHVARMLALAGAGGPAEAARVVALETRLAAGHWDVVRTRDAEATYTKLDRAGLEARTPGLDWTAWLDGFDADPAVLDGVVVRQPDFLTVLATQLRETEPADWRLWLAWQILRGAAPYLHRAVVEERFAFYEQTLSGVPEQRARWKRGIALVEDCVGEAAGALFVERHFPPEAKQRMTQLVVNLVEAYARNIRALPWMSEQTKARALDKLAAFTPKIGYPARWRDYSGLSLDRADLVGNVRAAARLEKDRNLAKLGGPVDRDEWFLTPQTVNAYYNPGMNEIVFPAAILQPPFFDLAAEDAVNYGAIGAVIGHEIGHGFDDQGSKFDGAGNLTDWWTQDDRDRFDELTRALVAQYAAFEPRGLPGHQVNGALTVGENIGDLGGLAIAYQAWRISREAATEEDVELDGFTGAQRLFIGWATVWQTKARPEEAVRRLAVDPHAPPEFRANVVRNLEEFYDAFGVVEGDGMWLEPKARVRIW